MSASQTILCTALVMLGIAGSFVCAGCEAGAYFVNRVRLNLRASGGVGGRPDPAAVRLKSEIERPERLLTTLMLGHNFFSSLAANSITPLLVARGYSEFAVAAINVGALTPVLFVLCDALPKEIFRADADRLAYRTGLFLVGLRWILTLSLIFPLATTAVQLLARIVRVPADTTLSDERGRMAALLKEGAHHGVLSEAQTTLLDRALELRDTTVGEELVPWSRVHSIQSTWDRRRVLTFLSEHGSSRFPLLSPSGPGPAVNVSGQVLHVVGVVEHLTATVEPWTALTSIARPLVEVSPELSVREALVRMTDAGAKLAVVTRFGKALGIVTAKDLFEPLTGELAAW
ncbi:MAG: DUF21 domain-containing protein [Phycisphaerae bacterium]|nr:DUF21 domain-containing protein [Phycisphaerae bacterium]